MLRRSPKLGEGDVRSSRGVGAKLEEAVGRVEVQLAQAAASEPPVTPAPEPTTAAADADADNPDVRDSTVRPKQEAHWRSFRGQGFSQVGEPLLTYARCADGFRKHRWSTGGLREWM